MANTATKTPTEATAPVTPDINKYRKEANILICLPMSDMDDQDHIENSFEVVTINGDKTYQIRKGETVSVPWSVFEAIQLSGRYKDAKGNPINILAN